MAETERYERLPSTQAVARRRAAEGAPLGTTIVAREQETGEGRAGHRWWSPPGGLYVSWLMAEPHEHLSLVPLAAALGLRGLVMTRYGVRSQVRWPNDLWVVAGPHRGGKVAGILVDRVERGSRSILVLGLGVNANARRERYPVDLRDSVACLHEWSEGEVDLDELERESREAVEQSIARLEHPEEMASLIEELRGALEGVGRRVRLDRAPVGILRGLADDGGLMVETDQGIRTYHAGTLEFEPEIPAA